MGEPLSPSCGGPKPALSPALCWSCMSHFKRQLSKARYYRCCVTRPLELFSEEIL